MSEQKVLRGFIANIDVLPPLILTFQFNPKEINDNKTVNYADARSDLCGNAPGKVYTSGGHRTLSFDIQLQGMEEGSNALIPIGLGNGISTELAKLRSFLYPKADAWASLGALFGGDDGGQRLSAPPTCVFGFGLRILECVVTNIVVRETQFNSWLAPVQASATITLVVNEEDGGGLYELDKLQRNLQSALGLQNVRIY